MDGAAAKAAGTAATVTAVTVGAHPVFLGITSDVMLAAFAGALFGLGWRKPEAWGDLLAIRGDTALKRAGWLFLRSGGIAFTLSGIAIVAAWVTVIAPHAPLLGWTRDVPAVPLGGLLAFAGQWSIPVALVAIQRRIERAGEGK